MQRPSHRGRLGLLDQELWLPQHNTHVKEIQQQLTAAEFDQHVAGYMQDPATQPFAFVGPSNFKADGWLLLRKALLDGTGRAVEPGEPFIIYTSRKQRMKQESVSAAATSCIACNSMLQRCCNGDQQMVGVYMCCCFFYMRPVGEPSHVTCNRLVSLVYDIDGMCVCIIMFAVW